MKLLSIANKKSILDKQFGYLSAIQYLDPSYNKEVCWWKTPECFKYCLRNSGMLTFTASQQAMYNRTKLFFEDSKLYYDKLYPELIYLENKANKLGLKATARLNGTSDLDFSKVYKDFPRIQFREYTKDYDGFKYRFQAIPNLHLVYSASEKTTPKQIEDIIYQGGQVAMVFNKIPETYLGHIVIPADDNDLTFLKPLSCILGLKAKGKARKASKEGFVHLIKIGGTK